MTAIGRLGVWISSRLWPSQSGEITDAAAHLESLGFDTIWLGGADGDLRLAETILAGTSRVTVATGIVNVWRFDAAEVAKNHHRVRSTYPDRFLLGIGVGHAPAIAEYEKPLSKLTAYLNELDNAPTPVTTDERIVAALRPRALAIAGARSLGSHPYLVPPEHTADARRILGAGRMLAPEQKIVLSADAEIARRTARDMLPRYLALPNYVNNLRNYGLTDDDFAGDGSDRLVDSVVAWGEDTTIKARIDAHFAAGADHVAIQVLSTSESAGIPLAELGRASTFLR